MTHQGKEPIWIQKEFCEHVIIKVFSCGFQLLLSKISEVVIGLTKQFFRTNEGIDQKSTTTDHSWDPAASTVATLIQLSRWEIRFLESTNSTPVRNIEELNSGHENLKDTSA